MKYRAHVIQGHTNTRPASFTDFGTAGLEQLLNVCPLNSGWHRILEYRNERLPVPFAKFNSVKIRHYDLERKVCAGPRPVINASRPPSS